MNLSDKELLSLNSLCQAAADGIATEAQLSELNRCLSDSEEARQYYVRVMSLCASLHDHAGEMQAEAPEFSPAFPTPARSYAWAWTLAGLAAAALVMLAFRVGMRTGERNPQDSVAVSEAETDEPIARLSAATDCHWQHTPSALGDELRRGQRMELASGFAEITFDSGAQVTMEGPAVLELRSAWEARLESGSLKASVPPEAIGFRVSNPSVDVVDLGTEFSMVAETGGATEVFVLKGSIEASAHDGAGPAGAPMIMRNRQARRFARGKTGEVADRDRKLEKFLRKIVMKRASSPAGYVQWSFDQSTGDAASARAVGVAQGDFDAHFFGAPNSPALLPGKWGSALTLDGRQFARASFPEITRRVARTMAFWVNIPEGASPSAADSMLSWSVASGRGSVPVEIAWNPDPGEGAFGALRTNLGAGYIVGTTSLRDGRWHHLAVVFTPKWKSDSAMHILQYVDGRLESPSSRHLGKRALRNGSGTSLSTGSADEALWIGCNSETRETNREHFAGALDELFVADRALAPQEIRRLMKTNTLGSAETVALD